MSKNEKTGCRQQAASAQQGASRGGGGTGEGVPAALAAVVLESDRDRRTLAWLRRRCGDAAVIAAVGRLVGARRAYVSNLARLLGVEPPAGLSDEQQPVSPERGRELAAAALSSVRRRRESTEP